MTAANAPLPPQLQAWRTRVFASTWLCYAGLYFCRKPFYIVKAQLGEAHGWDAAGLAWIGTAYLLSYTVGQFIAGWGGTRWGPRITLILGMAASIACNLAFGWTNSLATFTGLMVINGLAQATGWSGTVGTMANWFRRK